MVQVVYTVPARGHPSSPVVPHPHTAYNNSQQQIGYMCVCVRARGGGGVLQGLGIRARGIAPELPKAPDRRRTLASAGLLFFSSYIHIYVYIHTYTRIQ